MPEKRALSFEAYSVDCQWRWPNREEHTLDDECTHPNQKERRVLCLDNNCPGPWREAEVVEEKEKEKERER